MKNGFNYLGIEFISYYAEPRRCDPHGFHWTDMFSPSFEWIIDLAYNHDPEGA